MDVNQAIVKILEETKKMDYIFGSTGQVNASMLLALRDSNAIKTVIVRNEQAASFMACGYSMFSKKLGVCFATGGPGAFNLFSGLAVAYYDSLPVLAITGYTSANQRGKGALNESSGINRTPDSHKMFSATTKKSYIVEDASQICDIMEDALNTAFDGRPGPVHIHVPKDITTADVSNFREVKITTKIDVPKKESCDAFGSRLASALENKEKILLLIGYGCVRSEAYHELMTFVDQYHIPFITTMDAKGYLSEAHPLSLGIVGTTGDPLAVDNFKKADVVLAIGNSFAENATYGFQDDLFDNKTLMHINIDKNEINKVYLADYSMVADAKFGLEGILGTLKNRIDSDSVCTPELGNEKKWIDRSIEHTGTKIHPAELCKAISDVAPENAIIMGDAGAHMLWLSEYMKLESNQRYQNPGSFGPMASHTNGAIGVKCAHPDKTVISACGDGCYMMAGFELLTAIQNNIPVVWIIFNNGEFNIIKKFLLNMFQDYAYMDFINPDYCKFAEACGTIGFRIEKEEDLRPIIAKAIKLNKPVLIDVLVENGIFPHLNKNLVI
ncbi:MAG: thiamine pyrophosphate-binding protein [Lachnospiraceae bacterium]|nr:thiamine pyrophosphate-binding protein [Lachnospiraceae bacterium]